jgi:ferredoxin
MMIATRFTAVTTVLLIVSSSMIAYSSAFGLVTSAKNSPLFSSSCSTTKTTLLPLSAASTTVDDPKKPYAPKWVKKQTLADTAGDIKSLGFENVGLKGTIPVVFKQGNNTVSTKAWAGQPIRDVASQAGQYIQYGCGKGECGTCECMMNGKWVRPCIETIPATSVGEGELILQLKATTAKKTNSGTFFSIRSFLMGFYNNILGMLGFFKFRKRANENWNERQEYENLIAKKTLEKKLLKQKQQDGNAGGNAAPGMA